MRWPYDHPARHDRRSGAIARRPGRRARAPACRLRALSRERDGTRRLRALLAWARHEHYAPSRSEEHTSELQSLMRISYAVFCLKKKKQQQYNNILLPTAYI